MGKSRGSTVNLEAGFTGAARTRESHLNQIRVVDGRAVRDLQQYEGLSRGQATAMVSPKRGSRCTGYEKVM